MNPIDLSAPTLAPELTAGTRQDISFTQRHAWMREYEHAEHGMQRQQAAAQGAGQADDASATQATAGRREADAAQADGAERQAPLAKTALPRGTHAPAAVRAAGASMREAFTSTAAWLPMAGMRAALPLAAARLALPALAAALRSRELPADDYAEREMSVVRGEDTLSVTVRDARLEGTHGPEILRALNANGASLGMKHVRVTVNGRSTEQNTRHPLE